MTSDLWDESRQQAVWPPPAERYNVDLRTVVTRLGLTHPEVSVRQFLMALLIAVACALAPLAPVLAQTGPPASPQGVKPRTMAEHRAEARARSEAARAEQRRIEAEENAGAQQASDEANQRWEEMKARNAAQIRQFDEAVEDWADDNRPPGTAEDFVSTSYNEDTALADSARVTFYNSQDVPTHRVTFGPDAKPTGPLTLTQQGKAWETIGPQLVDGATWAATYGRDVHGEETIVAAEIVKDSKVIGFYEFNAEGLPWRGERWGPDGKRSGGFYDPRFEPPPRTVGSALPVPATPRLITGVCFACREKADRYNDLANQASRILAQMREQSAQNQQAFPEAQVAIKMRYDKLAADLAALMPELEAARAAALACEKTCQPQADPQPDAIAAGSPTGSTPKLPAPDLARPSLLPVAALQPPASFCDEFARVAYMNEVYTPAAKASLANAQTATAHLGKLGGMFTDYMQNEGGSGWAAVRQEQAAYGPIAEAATAESTAINALYQQILAIPIVPCGEPTRIATGDPAPPSGAPVSEGVGVIPARGPVQVVGGKKPCPPKTPRKPIVVGPNNRVGSGAQLTKKLGGMLVGGLLGAAGVGGGGGGGGGPQLYTCRIKDSEMTLFTHPSGLALRVGAKRGKGDTVNIFADIAKSPDKGTFQAALLETPDGGKVQSPSDAGPCDLWGDWQLTVSWTKTTYVDGQMVSQESGGWSEGGKFSLPGMLTKSGPQPMWASMGFSSASHGARKAFMKFSVPQGGGPLTFVTYITQPGGDPVMAVPFVMTMAETAPGVFTFTEGEAKPDCPEPLTGTTVSTTGSPPEDGTKPRPKRDMTGAFPIEPPWFWGFLPKEMQTLRGHIDAGDKDPCDGGYEKAIHQLQRIRQGIADFKNGVREAGGTLKDSKRQDFDELETRLDQIEAELKAKMAARGENPCPSAQPFPPVDAATTATTEDNPDSILDEIDQRNPAFLPLDPLPPERQTPPPPPVRIPERTDPPPPPVSAPATGERPKEAPLPPPDTRTTPPTPPPQGGAMTTTGATDRPTEAPLPPPDRRTTTPPPAPRAPPPADALDPRLAAGETIPFTVAPLKEIDSLAEYEERFQPTFERLMDLRMQVQRAAEACAAGTPPPRGEAGWADYEARYRKTLDDFLGDLGELDPVGPQAKDITDKRMGHTVSALEMQRELNATPPPTCPPRLPDDPGPPESILDDVDDVRPLG
jgi:hypothetical protein